MATNEDHRADTKEMEQRYSECNARRPFQTRGFPPRDVLEGGEGKGGGLKGGGGGWLGPPSSQRPPMAPAEHGPKIVQLKRSWRQRRRSKILLPSARHLEKGRRTNWVKNI